MPGEDATQLMRRQMRQNDLGRRPQKQRPPLAPAEQPLGRTVGQAVWERTLCRALRGRQRYVAQRLAKIPSQELPLLTGDRMHTELRKTVSGFFFSGRQVGHNQAKLADKFLHQLQENSNIDRLFSFRILCSSNLDFIPMFSSTHRQRLAGN